MLRGNCEEIVYMDNDAIIVIAGDLNRLNCAKLESDCGLSQLVDLNIRGSVTLDKFLTDRPDLFQSVSVFKPMASQSSDLPRRNTQAHVKSVMYDHSPVHIGNLCKALENNSWTGLLLDIEHKTVDVDTAFAEFNAIVNYFVEKYIPSRIVCIKPKDPAFITLAINPCSVLPERDSGCTQCLRGGYPESDSGNRLVTAAGCFAGLIRISPN